MDWGNVPVNTSFDKEKQKKYKKNEIYQIRCNTCRYLFSHNFVSNKDLNNMARYGLKCDDCKSEDLLYNNSSSSSSSDMAFVYDSPDDTSPRSLPKKVWSPPRLVIKGSPIPKSPPKIFGPPYLLSYTGKEPIKPKKKYTKRYLATLTGGKKRRKRKRTRRKSKRRKSRRRKKRKRRKTRR